MNSSDWQFVGAFVLSALGLLLVLFVKGGRQL